MRAAAAAALRPSDANRVVPTAPFGYKKAAFSSLGMTSDASLPGASRRTRLCLVVLTLALVAYAAIVVRDFSGPIGDHVESFLYEYLSYYVSKNLTFTPLPHLGLTNDQVFYPFGTTQALQSFCVERDLLFTFLQSTFGRGPWLQLYYMAGLAVSTYGSFFLLRKDHGDVNATATALVANLFNFYGAQKYPYHFNMACVHWTTLAIVVDFLLAERIAERRRLSLRLLLLRALLLVLGFGLELGHVVGYGLTTLLATTVFAFVMWFRRWREGTLGEAFATWRRESAIELRAHRVVVGALTAGMVLFALLYGSIVAQIVLATRQFDFRGVELGVWWSHPIRLFIPYTPWVHPSQQPRFLRVFQDQAEVGIGSGGAGLFVLALGAAGIWFARGRRLRFVPLLVVFFAFVVSRPGFDLVRWMPWFAFTRVFSRATVVYSTLLGIFAIGVPFEKLASELPTKSLRFRIPAAALGAFGLLELFTFGSIKMSHPAYAFDATFMDHMKKIEALPGEAVLDFPFCILGGNGDKAYLCPYMEKLKSVYALQRFHHKKVIGQYLGRVHPSQTQPFVDQGWPRMWDPDDPDPIEADHQDRCLTEAEWTFFTEFYEKNDFAGIQLAVDRLPPGCPEQFYARFGKPMGTVEIPKAGHLAFIPRDPATRGLVDKEAGKRAHLVVALTDAEELVKRKPARFVKVSGMSDYEWLGPKEADTARWKWALLPATELAFDTVGERELVLETRFRVPVKGQAIALELDGAPVDTWKDLPTEETLTRTLRAHVAPGHHVLRMRYAVGNAGANAFAPNDPRQMSVMFESLSLRADLERR